jgi:hypothetical protein
MHFAGCYKIPSITILGECYESAKLHQEQWGHPDGIVLGKESSESILELPKPNEIYTKMKLMFSNE